MSKSKNIEVVTTKIKSTSTNRSVKDIGKVKSAIQSAENIYNPSQIQLQDLYDYIMLDGTLTAAYNKLMDSILNKNLHFQDRSGRRVEEMEDVINSDEFRRVIKGIVEANFYGVTGLEFIPGQTLSVNSIPRKHINTSSEIITINQSDNEGINYEGLSNIWILKGENGLGKLSVCATYIVYKMACLGDWAQYIEVFGQPMKVFRYDTYDEHAKMQIKSILDESGSSLCLMLPKQVEFEILDGKDSNSDGELFNKLLKYLDGQILIIVLGVTETTVSSDRSGLAQSEVHAREQEKKVLSYLKYVQYTLNEPKFRRILKSYGYPIEEGKFVFEKEIEIENLKLRAKIESDLVLNRQLLVDHDYVYETYGIPKPHNYEEIMAKRRKLEESQKAFNSDLETVHTDDISEEETGLLAKVLALIGLSWLVESSDTAIE